MSTSVASIHVSGDRSPVTREMIDRPVHYLAQAGRRYPGFWKRADELRHRSAEVGGWPGHCFIPNQGVHEAALLAGFPLCGPDIITLSALTSWRPTQGVYAFDPTLLEELWRTPVEGVIPVQVLEQLPEWCCYIAFQEPRPGFGTELRHGFFVELVYDLETRSSVLQMAFDTEWPDGTPRLLPNTLLLAGNLSDSFTASFDYMQESVEADGGRSLGFEDRAQALAYMERTRRAGMAGWLGPYISLTLYLASTTREIQSRDGKLPEQPRPTKTRRDDVPRIIPPARPAIHECGFRLGATLRAGMAAAEARHSNAEREHGTHASPRAHLRRAHWHCYWTGPLSGQRKIVTKWLHPILVGAGEAGEDAIIPTVHRVAAPLQGSTAGGRTA